MTNQQTRQWRGAAWIAMLALLSPGTMNALAAPVTTDAPGRLAHRTLELDGRERSYAVYRPARPGGVTDTLLVLHGSGGAIERIRQFTGHRFERLAEERGFKLIYPQGFEGNWNGCRTAAPFSSNRLDVDDVAFLEEILDRESEPPGRRFVFGFSGGGHMAFRLALEAPGSIDGIAVVGANLPEPGHSDCMPAASARHPGVLLINGTVDPINPYHGGPVILPQALGGLDLGPVRSSVETARFFATRAGHEPYPRESLGPERDNDPDTAVRITEWRSSGLVPVTLATVVGGGHTIPGSRGRFPELAGRHTADLETPLAVWRFFMSSSRKPPPG